MQMSGSRAMRARPNRNFGSSSTIRPSSGLLPDSCGIEDIDVETEVGGRRTGDFCSSFGDGAWTEFVNILRGDDRDALRNCPVVDFFLDRRTDADLHRAPGSISRSSMA